MNSSISRRLILWLAVPLLLLTLCGALVHYYDTVAPGVIASDQRLREATNGLMAQPRRRPSPESVLYAVYDSAGRLLEGDPRLPVVPLTGDLSQIIAFSQIGQRTVRSMTTRFQAGADGPSADGIITVADVHKVAEPAARLGLMNALLWDFVQIDVTLVLVWVGIRLGLRPIDRLRDEIGARSPHDLRPIDEASVPREIAPVVVTLNRLFNTLRAAVQSQQQFIANTAHQLRTPLTGLQAQLDLLVTEAAALPVQGRLRTLQEGIRQLAHSANQLLALARADPAVNLAAKNHSIALDASVGEVAARFFDRALQSQIDLGVDVQRVAVPADPALIDDLLSNLVDNALKYTPAGGSVTVSAGVKSGRAYLAVEDTGPGIPEAERQRVRQRFYRLPNSPGHGSGLGLAIVDEIAKLYGATLLIEAATGTAGTKVSVIF